MVAAIILAAGRSTRMGQSKPLLAYGGPDGQTFVARLIDVLKTPVIQRVIVVGRPEDARLQDEVARCGATFVENPRAEEGQLSSLLTALNHLRERLAAELHAIVVVPADAPLISADTVDRLMRAAERSPAQILRATHAGQHGHPVLFRQSVFDELAAADPAVGARAVVRADPSRVEEVEMADAGVTIDFDTPEDYRRYFGWSPSTSR